MKTCRKCGCVLTEENSSPSAMRKGSYCRVCNRRFYRTPKENAENCFLKAHGISKESFLRVISAQNGKCAICEIELTFNRSLSLACQDHDHETKKLREVLCMGCNVMLGYAKDNIEILKSAIAYLEKHSEGSTIQTNGLEAN